jgi:hypothetical protein
MVEADAVLQAEDLGSLPGKRQRVLREIHGSDFRAVTGEIYGVCADATPNLENLLSPPAFELRERRDMRFHTVFPVFHFMEILFRTNRLRGVPNVTGTDVPITLNFLDGNIAKCRGRHNIHG